MSKINQIQNKLLELDGGAFQKLMDTYLSKYGYSSLNPIGSVAGADKTKVGTPDTLILTENGRYIFVEYTTQKDDIAKKFEKDIYKCLDESKTGIPISKIEKIILCSNSDIETHSIENLRRKCLENSVQIDIIGLQSLSLDLLNKFPGIAKDHLSIEIDTGQILPIDEFIETYSKNSLTTSLKTSFRFRKEETKKILDCLDNEDLVLISGPSGV